MIGKTFGRWTVLREAPRDKHNALMYLCECSCGTIKSVRKKPLVLGRSLGCQKCYLNGKRKRDYENVYNILVRVANKREQGEGILSYEDFISVINSGAATCFYCGVKISWAKYVSSLKDRKMNYSLDRKDNSKGYSKDNVVACCKECNYTKSDVYTFEEMLMLKPALMVIQERRSGMKSLEQIITDNWYIKEVRRLQAELKVELDAA